MIAIREVQFQFPHHPHPAFTFEVRPRLFTLTLRHLTRDFPAIFTF